MPGEPGAPGEQGPPGEPGTNGVGISSVHTADDGCSAVVALTDGTERIVGPFCTPPPGTLLFLDQDGAQRQCSRSGGGDSAPTYTCTMSPPTGPSIPVPTPTG